MEWKMKMLTALLYNHKMVPGAKTKESAPYLLKPLCLKALHKPMPGSA